MIRKIGIGQLIPGMYVVDLHKSWLDHGFWRTRFRVRDRTIIRRLMAAGIQQVSIDTARGLDIEPDTEPTPTARINAVARTLGRRAASARRAPVTVSLGEERRRATSLLAETQALTQDMMERARHGGTVEAARLEPVVTKMIASVRRNPDALIPLARLKRADYVGEHAVSTAALITALAWRLEVPEPQVERLALGALVKDVGAVALDARLGEKHGNLSPDELELVQGHVEESLAALDAPARLGETSVAVILEHHERFDGLGYPYGLQGEDISLAGRMAAIVDTYDAMTSDRPYRRALSPAAALAGIFEQGGQQFDPELVASFIHTVGLFPVGTLVRLESGHLAVVVAQHADQPLEPMVRVIYHADWNKYVTPVEVDLSRRVGNHYGRVVQAEEFERWGINPAPWQPT
ncbi:MAG: HD-GYP domain-containing protein [Betaproteobacteria bacterium]